jgi:hypothetical protein
LSLVQAERPVRGIGAAVTDQHRGRNAHRALLINRRVHTYSGWAAIDGLDANTQSTVQIEGSGWQIPIANFLEIYKASDPFRSAINNYQGVILFQAQQSAGYHAIHSVEARFCRWLLLSQDILGSEQVPLIQEFLSHMLGVQRTSVSLCAHTLQKSGLIQTARGKIKILNRKGLEERACECYWVIRERIDSVIPPSAAAHKSGSGPKRHSTTAV